MAKFELPKSIEARKLNKRSGLPLDQIWLTIPYGALLDNLEEDRDLTKFTYLGELYHSKDDVLKAAFAAPAPAASAPTAAAARAEQPALRWEPIATHPHETARAKVPGGWLVLVAGAGLAFYPDPGHTWDGTTLP